MKVYGLNDVELNGKECELQIHLNDMDKFCLYMNIFTDNGVRRVMTSPVVSVTDKYGQRTWLCERGESLSFKCENGCDEARITKIGEMLTFVNSDNPNFTNILSWTPMDFAVPFH